MIERLLLIIIMLATCTLVVFFVAFLCVCLFKMTKEMLGRLK